MNSTPKRKITRHRESLACTDCRRRKLKCDRCTPCGSCARREDGASCTYQRFVKGSEHERERRLQAESRLEHLEELVQQFAQHGDQPVHQTSFVPQVQEQEVSQGRSRSENGVLVSNGILYNGSTHWSAMLEDIEELRFAITSSEDLLLQDDHQESHPDLAINLVLGSATSLPLQEVLAQYLPPKQESDDLVSAYFRSAGIAAPFIHVPSFQRQYGGFWDAPQETSGLWISMLFSIYHVASNTLKSEKVSSHLDQRYIIASASCLAQCEYFRPQDFAVESILLFAQAQILTGPSMSPTIGLLFSLLIRLATSMGYHKDPELFQLSAFEKEMRRRVWSLCMQLDLLISFQLGLPSNVQFPTWDTLPPRNLHDADFDEETQELPPARPDSEMTNMIFYIAKHRLMTVFEKILRHTLTTGAFQTSRVDELDDEIRKVYSDLPQNLRPRSISDSIFDSPILIVTRLCVSNLYQKCLCVLHRPYVIQGRLESVRICHEAALSIVRYFNDSFQQFLPGGQMESERWFLGSLTWHDYLLGVTALCLTLCVASQLPSELHMDTKETLSMLPQVHDICVEQSMRSKDSTKISKLVQRMMLRFGGSADGVGEELVGFSRGTAGSFDSPSRGMSLFDNADTPTFELQNDDPNPAAQNERTIISMDDTSWQYLDQFLNLPMDHFMPNQ